MDIHIGKYGYYLDQILRLKYQVKYKIQKGLWLPLNSEMFIGIYEQYDDFLPDKNTTVLDIGSQYGDYAIICNKKYHADVIAFEPLLNNCYKIKKYANINKAVITIYPFAIGTPDRFANIPVKNNMIGYNFSNTISIRKDMLNAQTVHFVPLDYFNFKNVDLVKIDVEGFEMEVLHSGIELLKKFKPKIIIETHSAGLYKQVKEFLEELGYSFVHENDVRTVNNRQIANMYFKVVK